MEDNNKMKEYVIELILAAHLQKQVMSTETAIYLVKTPHPQIFMIRLKIISTTL